MSSSFFLLVRKLKNANVYARELARQYALFRSVSDQVDNPRFKAYSRLKNYRLVIQENATINQKPASEYQPYVPPEGTPPPPPPTPPGPSPPPGPPSPPPTIQDAKFVYPNSNIDMLSETPPDGSNVEANVNDGSLSTRWSAPGLPQGLEIDLGEVKRVAFVRVAWYRGDERTCGYKIETGAVAGGGMTVRKTGTSSGNTTGFETYDFTDVNARWIWFTVTSNSQNNFASIAELEIWGNNDQEPSPPPPGPPGPPAPPPGPPSPPGNPTPQGTAHMMFTFANTINDSSGQLNHALMDGGTIGFTAGATSSTGQAINLNPLTGTSTVSIAPTAVINKVFDHGGPVWNKYTNAQVWLIFWGSEWNSTSTQYAFDGIGAPSSIPGTLYNASAQRATLVSNTQKILNSDHFAGFWQYRNIKKPVWGGSVVHTATSLPGSFGSLVNSSSAAPKNVVNSAISSGQVPDPTDFDEVATVGPYQFAMDLRHVYCVMLPPSRWMDDAAAWASRRIRDNSNVWFLLTAHRIFPPRQVFSGSTLSGTGGVSGIWSHEMSHIITETGMVAGCGSSNTGAGFQSDSCESMNHGFADGTCCCGGTRANSGMKRLLLNGSTTDINVESIWSNRDGRCIYPAAGDTTWTKPPGYTPPSPPPGPPSPPPPGPAPPPSPPAPPSSPPSSETFQKLWVPFSNTNRVIIDTSPGFSVYCSIFPYTVASTSTGNMRCIWIKQDDMHNGAHALIGSDGTVYFNVIKANVRYKVRTNPGVVAANTWYQLWFTFNKTTNVAEIYANNVKYNTTSTVSEAWNNKHSHWIIGNYDVGSATRPFRGKIDDFRLYRNGVVTSTAVTNMAQNNFTIETIPFGQDHGVAIAGFLKVDSKQTNNVFVITDVVEDDILASPPPPPPTAPDGSDDLPLPPEPEPIICNPMEE